MPSTRELSAALQVSRATVAAAYDQLIAEGHLDGRRGSGTFVSQQLPERDTWSGRAALTRAAAAPIRLAAPPAAHEPFAVPLRPGRRGARGTPRSHCLGPRATIIGDAAGMHVVVRFDGPEIARRAGRNGVRLLGTAEYYSGAAVPHEFILRFSGL